VVTEIEIAAPPARVFRALIEREQALQWGGGEAFEITEWKWTHAPQLAAHFRERSGAGTGKIIRNIMVKFCRSSLRVAGSFLVCQLASRTRRTDRGSLGADSNQRGTHVIVTHSGLAALPGACEGYSQGWPGLVAATEKIRRKITLHVRLAALKPARLFYFFKPA